MDFNTIKNYTKSNVQVQFEKHFSNANLASFTDFNNLVILPGLCDVHVHLREPGFSYKENIKSGTMASAKGGVTAVCSMPNLKPVPDSEENLKVQTDIIERDAVIKVYPYASITLGQKGEKLCDFKSLHDKVVAFSDDGKGVQDAKIIERAMILAKKYDKVLVCHCEDESLLYGGYIHDGEYAKAHGHKGICSASEYKQVERDLELVEKIGCKYHVCHVSTLETVELIRMAKKKGLNVTCETAPHYLILSDDDLKEEGRFKMNPPLRSNRDKQALIEGILDGTIDMIATDHAPHSEEEKSRGLKDSVFGIVGIENSFQLMFTHFVKTGILSMEKLMELMSFNPAKRFNIDVSKDFSVWDLSVESRIEPKEFLSMGRATPFENHLVFGKNLMTIVNGKKVYSI